MVTKVKKITLSLSRDAIQFADELAKERRESRSKVISSCLSELAKKRLQEQMAEGYRAMATENKEFASVAVDLAHEILPEWE